MTPPPGLFTRKTIAFTRSSSAAFLSSAWTRATVLSSSIRPKACLVVGVAVPARDDESRARAVRDRFVTEVLPKIVVTTPAEPKERY